MPIAVLTDADSFPWDDDDRAALAEAGVELRELAGHRPQDIVRVARHADVLFVYYARLTATVLDQLEGVRVIARCGAGFDNIDVPAARQRGVQLAYVPDYGIDDIADHALALLLTCARKVTLGDRTIRSGEWRPYAQLAPMHRLSGRTLGVYGYGRIGRNLAAKARCLGFDVISYDPYVDDGGVTRDELFRRSDFLSIHVPLTEETRHCIGHAELSLMKPGAVLVNTARGTVIVTSALVAALREGRLGGAGLDVYEEEPLGPDHALRSCETAVLTPHSAAFTEEALAEVRKRALADAVRLLRGQPARDPI